MTITSNCRENKVYIESLVIHGMMVAVLLLATVITSGCAGIQAYPYLARAGDTVAMAVDRQPAISKQDITVRITDSTSSSQDIPGTDPSVRAWIDMYPDPVSKLVVGRETSQNLGVGAKSWGLAAEFQSDNSKNWFESFLFLDLPTNLATGAATVDILDANMTSILPQAIALDIVPGMGAPNTFETFEYGNLSPDQFHIMERADHYTVSFSMSGTTVPTAIQVDIGHDPDKQNNGVGQVYVAQPRSDINAVSWTDDGTSLRVILLPSWYKTPEDVTATVGNERTINWFDFYIAGGITGLQTPVITAYDENGATVSGVSAMIQ